MANGVPGRKDDLVSSFVTAFSGEAGALEGICVKFAMRNGKSRLSYFDQTWLSALRQCAEYYSGLHYYGSDMQREADELGSVARLPPRHPVRTMASEKPDLAGDEYDLSKQKFRVTSLRMIDQGDRCHLVCVFADGRRRVEILPGYIVMNLCGYLKACQDAADLMKSSPQGSA